VSTSPRIFCSGARPYTTSPAGPGLSAVPFMADLQNYPERPVIHDPAYMRVHEDRRVPGSDAARLGPGFAARLDVMANQLGEFLRARRARLSPADVGQPSGLGRRRTPGLRREELAAIAGLSIDYYIRLEQGKETNPSGPILDGLARALQLNDEEQAHLYALANLVAGRTARQSSGSSVVRPGIRQLLETVRPYPAYVLSRVNDILAVNPEGLALFHGLSEWPPQRHNTIRYTFLHPAARDLLVDWDRDAAHAAAHLRALEADYPGDQDLRALIAELRTASPEFARLWPCHEVRHRRGERKPFRHPRVGEFALTTEVLYLEQGQRMTIYQARPGTRDHDAMTLLSMVANTPSLPR
jgi:transcriptional regulator with XRE-family HTH domain